MLAETGYTLENYVRLEEQSLEKHEYYHGQIIQMPAARGTQNTIAANVICTVKTAAKTSGRNYKAFSSDQKIYLPTLNFVLYSNALVVSQAPQYWDDDEELLINPILIVDVLPQNAYERVNKFREYKTLPSFVEYVLIEQTTYQAETFFREEPNLWRDTIVTDSTGTLSLQSLGCSIQMADIYEHIQFPL